MALAESIKGRIQAFANVHALFVQSRWSGAELSSLAMQELAPYVQGDDARADIDGPRLLLEPEMAQTMAAVLHESDHGRTMTSTSSTASLRSAASTESLTNVAARGFGE